MKTKFKDNIAYKVAFHSKANDLDFYEPTTDSQYHVSRYVAAGAQNIYSMAGLTPALIDKILMEMEKAVNTNNLADVAVWINNLKYRLKYPSDEDAILRMAALFIFLEGEDPDKTEPHWTERKLELIKEDAEAYTFFMKAGIAHSTAYADLPGIASPAYFQNRREELNALTPKRQ